MAKFDILLDLAAGSSGKGAAVARLADLLRYPNVSCNHGANAGHWVRKDWETGYLFKTLPSAAAVPLLRPEDHYIPRLWVGPNSTFERSQILLELAMTGYLPGDTAYIHSRAALVDDYHKTLEGPDGMLSTLHISSTMSGAGAAYALKAMRQLDTLLAEEVPELKALSPQEFHSRIQEELGMNRGFLHEVAQGFDLSLDYGMHTRHCLNKDALVLCADGSKQRLCDIVSGELSPEVWSLSKDGEWQAKRVVGWVKNQHDGDWYSIDLEYNLDSPSGGKWGPKFTPDHSVETRRGKVKVVDLQPGDELRSGEAAITGTALQVLLGSALGDGHFNTGVKRKTRKTVQYQETHSVAQTDYIRAKADLLRPIIGGRIESSERNHAGYANSKPQWRYNSGNRLSLRRFAERYGVLNKADLNVETIVRDIDWLGVAIWYQDDGSVKKQQYDSGNHGYEVNLHSQGFSQAQNQLLAALLTDKLGITFSVRYSKHVHGSGSFIAIPASQTPVFFDKIKNYIAPGMEYKVPECFGETSWSALPDTPVADYVTVVGVSKIAMSAKTRSRKGYNQSYCIEVEDNHNFFVQTSHGHYVNVDNCTYRNCTAQQACADMGILPRQVGRVFGNLRTYPIRVGNNYRDGRQVGYSGDWHPDQVELDWQTIGESAGMPQEEIDRLFDRELTTVTKKLRRVASFSFHGLKYGCAFNGVTDLILNFPQYLDWRCLDVRGGEEEYRALPDRVRQFVDQLEDETGLAVVMIGTGADHDSFILPRGAL